MNPMSADPVGSIHVFTSISGNYVPKARVLAESVKSRSPQVRFCLLVAEPREECERYRFPEFDEVVSVEDLGIPDLRRWLFRHSLVELCTAVKGVFLSQLLARPECSAAVYFDPDIVALARVEEIVAAFGDRSVLLTPHLTDPEATDEGVRDNEMAALRHGIYNLGFLAVRADDEGRRFAAWWWERLARYCRDDIPLGLFTDQRWVDLAPAFFDCVGIVRDPGWNVATWNLGRRRVEGTLCDGLTANGRPLRFFHFSGLDSGAQLLMLRKYGGDMPALFELRDWYLRRCDDLAMPGPEPRWAWGSYCNGEPITNPQRRLYALREDLQRAFPDPFATEDVNRSYYDWFRVNRGGELADRPEESAEVYRRELEAIHASHAWRLLQRLRRLATARAAWRYLRGTSRR